MHPLIPIIQQHRRLPPGAVVDAKTCLNSSFEHVTKVQFAAEYDRWLLIVLCW
jgi:hypothetical protein